jgi:hypothetical protein
MTDLSKSDMTEIQDAFIAEFGAHKAANSQTGALLGIEQDEPGERPDWSLPTTTA